MAMSAAKKGAITVVVLAAFAGALFFALRDQQVARIEQEQTVEAASTVVLQGLIALDVEAYVKDERVVKLLAAKRLPVNGARIGSRDMAVRVTPSGGPNFFFSSGVLAANQVAAAAQRAKVQSAPFHTPLVLASWEPIAKILVAPLPGAST